LCDVTEREGYDMANIQELNAVVDEIFLTLEEVRALFQNWNASCHTPFIQKVMHINTLRERLYKLGYTEEFVETVIKIAYNNVFTGHEQIRYAGNWSILA
jgi:hypothetical protein